MKTVAFCTLGCKVNQYETESLKELFAQAGYRIEQFDAICDVYVINSCTVTANGDKKTRQMVSRARRNNPNGIVALIGCLAQRLTKEEKQQIDADIILGTGNKTAVLAQIEAAVPQKDAVDDIMQYHTFCETPISGTNSERARGYIKIQDGCNRFCSYCIIPYVRGPVRSRSLENIQSEAKRLAENGQKEIVLTGIQVGAFGDDLNHACTLADAVEAASVPNKVLRVRLSSMEPTAVTPAFLERCRNTQKFCDHFHLSLQSGCDKILRAMNRRYTTAEYAEKCSLIRDYFPNASITTDVIAGFPGETEADFAETLQFIEHCKLSKIHAFPYSPRSGTKAASMLNLPSKAARTARTHQLIALSDRLRMEFLKEQFGKTHTVYFEQYEAGVNFGYTENYIYVRKPSTKNLVGQALPILLDAEICYDAFTPAE